MFLNNWLVWVGLFAIISIIAVVLKRPAKKRTQPGKFDNHIHTKPIFQIATIIIFLLLGFYLSFGITA